jgi:hypothetical protein
VTLFWVLAGVVVPAAVFRVGMAVVDRVRPRGPGGAGGRPAAVRGGRALRMPELTLRMPRFGTRETRDQPPSAPASATLPWFTPDADPGTTTTATTTTVTVTDPDPDPEPDAGAGTPATDTTKTKGNT